MGSELIVGLERLHRRDGPAALQDAPDNGMDRRRIALQQRLRRGGALRHPGPLVKQPRGGEQRSDIDLHDLAAHRPDARHGGLEQAGRLAVAQEVELVRARQADPEPRPEHRVGTGGRASREYVLGIEAGGDLVDQRGVRGVAGEDRDAVEGPAGRHDPPRTPSTLGRLQAHQAIERRRHAARSGGVGAEREGDDPRGDGHGRAGAGSAADVGAVMHRRAGAIGRASPHQAGGELVEVGLADQHRARSLKPLDDGGRVRGPVCEGGAAGGGAKARHVDVVLHREGDAG